MAQQQQYSYGYGYNYGAGGGGGGGGYGTAQMTNFVGCGATRPAHHAQQASYPAVAAAAVAYSAPKTSVVPAHHHHQHTLPPRQPQPHQQQTGMGQAQAGYYTGQSAVATSVGPPSSSSLPHQPHPHQQPHPQPHPPQQHQAATSAGFFGYQHHQQQQQYRAGQQSAQAVAAPPQLQTSYHQSYYTQQHSSAASGTKTTPTATPTISQQGVGYGSSPSVSSLPAVAYPSTYPSYYGSAASRYSTYNSGGARAATTGAKQGYSAPAYTPSSAGYPSTSSYNTVQEKVIANYIAQKTSGGGGGGSGGRYPNKRPYNPNNQTLYFCEVCKISCASSATYKTHLEGKAHKKKLNSQQQQTNGAGEGGETTGHSEKIDNADKPYYCPLCEVQCTNRDSYSAHIRGARHTKTVNLYRKLGKAIPEIKLPEGTEISTTVTGKKVNVNAPRIDFVGGRQLTSTGATEKSSGPPSVYPPTAPAAPAVTASQTSGGESQTAAAKSEAGDEDAVDQQEVEPVGEEFVVAVANDAKFPHATYKCTMCDCFFNDDWAKKAHSKGRRHRLNYKKLYQPDLYVEPSKSNRKKSERQRELRQTQGGGGARGRGRGGGRGGGGGAAQQVSAEALRRMEAEELSKLHTNIKQAETGDEMYVDGPPGGGPHPLPLPLPPHPHHHPLFDVEQPTHFYPARPRNPRDDRLVMSKHGSICPLDSEAKAVEQAVNDVEAVLKAISDDILTETCKQLSEEQGKEISREEKHRRLKGVMRVGAYARSLMLRGECNVDLVLMCTGRPNNALFHDILRRMPEKFEEMSSELVYNINEDLERAAILVISQVEGHRVQVTLSLTSTEMRETPSPEQSQADEEAGVLHHPSCSAALAALRHTKWFQMVAQGLPSCSILMRVLKDICRRVPAWGVLDSWILELLVQKNLMSANPDYTRPGDVFRRVMECVASGIFLPGGSGLQDPCEKGTVDASSCLSAQERVNITLSAQHALRLIAYGKAHLVLGVDPLPSPGSAEREGEKAAASDRDKSGEELPEEPEVKRPRVASLED